jgi:hypothetical protein
MMIDRPHVQRLLGDVRVRDQSDAEFIVYKFGLPILNVRYERHFARRRGLLDAAEADEFLAGNLRVLHGRRRELSDIIDCNRGYDPDFRDTLRGHLGSIDAESIGAGQRPGGHMS